VQGSDSDRDKERRKGGWGGGRGRERGGGRGGEGEGGRERGGEREHTKQPQSTQESGGVYRGNTLRIIHIYGENITAQPIWRAHM
jgi:hypothetical protein